MGLRGPGAQKIDFDRPKTVYPGETRVDRVINFVESLPVTSGTLAGQNFKLREWQKRIIDGIYGPVDDSGRRLVREAVLSFPRKNGKTGLTAALALAHLCGPEAERRGQVYSAAAERMQAALIYNEMAAIIDAVPAMRNRVIVRDFNKNFEDTETGSTFTALSSDAKSKHGYSASCIIYDELAQAPDRKLYDVLTTSTGARKEPLTIVISTQSGDPKHVMSELVDYGEQVNSGLIDDPSFYACIFKAPEDADPWSEDTWHACNPALGDFRSIEEMRDAAAKAQRMPAREAAFRLLYLNQRVQSENPFIARSDWEACGEKINQGDLKDLECYAGLDLSSKNDLTSLSLIFLMPDGSKRAISRFWSSQDGLEDAEARDRAPYRLWASQGHLLTTPGRVIDYRGVAIKLGEFKNQFGLQKVACDPWKLEFLNKELEDMGIDLELISCGQSFKEMDPAVTCLENDLKAKRLFHDRNPVMTWCIDNVRVVMDAAGNRKFDKRKATGRIDGAVSLAMANHLASNMADDSEPQFFILGEEPQRASANA